MASARPVKAAFSTAHCSAVGAASVEIEQAYEYETASAKNPVDLVHLSRQSLGDRSLENEILQLFKSQSVLYLERLENAKTADQRKFAAHIVVGSARGLGAWKVAKEAKALENKSNFPCDTTPLRKAVEEANAYIEELLADG